jgi:hypothetical protein
MAFWVIRTSQKIEGGLPVKIMARMYFNIALDFGLGLIPVAGDILDVLFRANTRNAAILESYLYKEIPIQVSGATLAV